MHQPHDEASKHDRSTGTGEPSPEPESQNGKSLALTGSRSVAGQEGAARPPSWPVIVRGTGDQGVDPRALIVLPAKGFIYSAAALALLIVLLIVLVTAVLLKPADPPAETLPAPMASETASPRPSATIPTEYPSVSTSPSLTTPSPEGLTTASPDGPQATDYTILFGPRNLRLPRADTGPGDCPDTVVDLDAFIALPVAEIDDDTDLVYGECFNAELRRVWAYAGLAPTTQPSAEACESAARSQPFGFLRGSDLKAKEVALCVVTSEGNVAWMLLVQRDGEDLLFRTIIWKRAPGSYE